MLIPAKNPTLYRDWLSYFERFRPTNPADRTSAFFNSQRGLAVPLI